MGHEKKNSKINIGLLTFPLSVSGLTPISNFVEILLSFSNVWLVTGNEAYHKFKTDNRIQIRGIFHKSNPKTISRVFGYIMTQFKIAYNVGKLSNKVDLWIFFIGGDTLLLPMLVAKLFKKKVIITMAGSSVDTLMSSNDNMFRIIKILSSLNNVISDKIILYTPNLCHEWRLNNYKDKILIAHRHFIDFNKFNCKSSIINRKNKIGYIGRFNKEKGVMNFIKSIPIINKSIELHFYLIGEGSLDKEIYNFIKINKITNIEIINWVTHDKLAEYLNEFKLVIIPSYTEGLPNILLESMACGTPVLANAVGGIPHIIKDQENGFLMLNNEPETIAKNILRAIDYPSLDVISNREICDVKCYFVFDKVKETWMEIIERILSD